MSADVLQQLGEPEVSVKPWFLELTIVLAPIAFRQISYPFSCHSSAEKPRHHRRVDDHANVVLFAERQDSIINVRMNERVGRLQRVNAFDIHCALQLCDVEV